MPALHDSFDGVAGSEQISTEQNCKQMKKKLGLVFSGGGGRGFAHLGVLKALEEHGIKPDYIAGTSAGAIVGSLYANGYVPEEVRDILMEKSFFSYAGLSLPTAGGILKLSGIEELLKEKLTVKRLEDLDIPLSICVTNMNKGVCEYFRSGLIVPSVLASASIPVIFSPVKIGDYEYSDGGLLNNLPVEAIEEEADIIFGVNVTPPGEAEDLGNVLKMAERSFYLSIAANMRSRIKRCDYYIEMPQLMKYSLLKSGHGQEVFDVGYRIARSYLSGQGSNLSAAL